MTSQHHEGQPYQVLSSIQNGRRVTLYRMSCGGCAATIDMNAPRDYPPDTVLHHFARGGWLTAKRNRLHNRCPACQTAKRADAAGDSARKIMAAQPVSAPQITPAPEARRPILKLAHPMEPDMPTAPATEARPANKVEIRKILGLMDGHFDDAKGCYFKGWSDVKVGQELNLPPKMVEAVREEYGLHLKVPAHIEQMKSDLDTLKSLVLDFEKRLTAEIARLSA